jgi:3-dehydroquinate synthase
VPVPDHIVHSVSAWSAWREAHAFSDVVILSDTQTAEHCVPMFASEYLNEPFHHLSVDPGEQSKDLSTLESVVEVLLDAGIDRDCLLICVGGGVVTDLGGFLASTFKRGIAVAHVPTTHLAMVDAALGGKNGLNFQGTKNQIGTFYPASCIVLDPRFLNTLPERELISGWSESVKHALIADTDLWNQISVSDPLKLARDPRIILRSANIKSKIAASDMNDGGIRQALNFGHTIGHAVEAESHLLHGEAIAFGMVGELWLSKQLSDLPQDQMDAANSYIKLLHPRLKKLKLDPDRLIDRMRHDKKNSAGHIRFTLISEIGQVQLATAVSPDIIRQALNYTSDYFHT